MRMRGAIGAIAVVLSVLSLASCARDSEIPSATTPGEVRASVAAFTPETDRFADAAIALVALNVPDRPATFDVAPAARSLLRDASALQTTRTFSLACADVVAPFERVTVLDVAALVVSESNARITTKPELAEAIALLMPSAGVLSENQIARLPEPNCSAPPPSMPVQSAVSEAIAFSCSDSEADIRARNGPRVTFGDTSIYIGYQQVSSKNQDPRLVRFDNGKQTWCRDDYEVTRDDSQGYGLVWDGDRNLYAAFSSTGSQGTASEDFREFARNGWLSSYGSGGGPKVAVLTRIHPETGNVETATFLTAQLSSGKSNTVVVNALGFENDELSVWADSFYSPRRSDRQPFQCEGVSPFDYSISFSADLTQATRASVRNSAASSCR